MERGQQEVVRVRGAAADDGEQEAALERPKAIGQAVESGKSMGFRAGMVTGQLETAA